MDNMSSYTNTHNENAYEYPDPEMIAGGVWPVNDALLGGSTNSARLREISSALQTAWPHDNEAEDSEDLEDRDFVADVGDPEQLNSEDEGGLDINPETDDQSNPGSEADDSDATEPEPPAVVRTGRRGRPRGRGRGRPRVQGRGPGRPRKNAEREDLTDHPRNHRKRNQKIDENGIKRPIKRGLRKALPASAKFSELQSEATKAFIEGNYEKAEKLANEALIENPEQFSAHSLLSEIFYEKGDTERSVAALFTGAHVSGRDPNVWERSAETILERTGDLQDDALLENVIYCYGRVLTLRKDRIDIRVARSRLYREVGKKGRAFKDLEYVLQKNPTDTEIMRMAIDLAVETRSTKEAINLCQRRIEILREESPQQAISFDWADLYIYSSLLIQLDRPAESLVKLKRAARWVCGRGDDAYWEYQTQDDCEFDLNAEPRRVRVSGFKESRYDDAQYGAGLPLEIRVHLGILRLQCDDTEEALMHFQCLAPSEEDTTLAEDFPDLYQMVGESYIKKNLYTLALSFLEPLREFKDFADAAYYAQMADCYRHLGQLDQAETCYKALMRHDEYDRRARKDMAEMFHAAKMTERAAMYDTQLAKQLAHQKKRKYRSMHGKLGQDDSVVLGVGEQGQNTGTTAEGETTSTLPTESVNQSVEGNESFPRKKPRRQHHRTKAAKSAEQEDLQEAFLELADFDDILESGNSAAKESWIQSARGLLRIFRDARVFYPHDRSIKFLGYTPAAQAKAQRPKSKQYEIDSELAAKLGVPIDQLPKDNVPDEFCDVPFEDWLDLFLRLAVMLSHTGKRQDCYPILELARSCNVFYNNKDYMTLINLTTALCALNLDDDEKVGATARSFMTLQQFNSDTYRLYTALFRMCSRPNTGAYNMSILQKFVLRQIRAIDSAMTKSGNQVSMSEDQQEPSDREATKGSAEPVRLDVALLFLYGQMLSASGSHIFALNYLYRARSLDPTNPLINLSIGIAYVHHALKRQGLNRHQLIMQGFVFLFQYHDTRMQSDIIPEQQEATFNIGRTFHLLGLVHLAIPQYEKVLQLAEKLQAQRASSFENTKDDNPEDFAIDAAFALQSLYAFGGNMVKAKEIIDKWMVL